MSRFPLLIAAAAAAMLGTAQAAPPAGAPQRAPDAPAPEVYKSATLSSEAYEPKTELPTAEPIPNCQLKIGSDWSQTPTKTLAECAALLDQKTPAQPKPMTTAYWNKLYLSADDKNIYQADPQSSAWSVLQPRQKH